MAVSIEKNEKHSQLEKGNAALHFFHHLLMFFALGFVAFAVGNILFQAINKFFPDQLSFGGGFDQGSVKFGIASLLVAAPLFFLMARTINRNLLSKALSVDSAPRRWLTYIVLFIASATIVGDLIALIFNYLEGDIALRFVLKVLVILASAGGIFSYYLWDVRKNELGKERQKTNRLALRAATAVVTLVFMGAFFLVDRPSVAKSKRLDQETVSTLQQISSLTDDYYRRRSAVPGNLDELKKVIHFELNQPVDYRKTGELTYELCADFRLPTPEEATPRSTGIVVDEWRHGSGKVCFDKEVLKVQDLGDGAKLEFPVQP